MKLSSLRDKRGNIAPCKNGPCREAAAGGEEGICMTVMTMFKSAAWGFSHRKSMGIAWHWKCSDGDGGIIFYCNGNHINDPLPTKGRVQWLPLQWIWPWNQKLLDCKLLDKSGVKLHAHLAITCSCLVVGVLIKTWSLNMRWVSPQCSQIGLGMLISRRQALEMPSLKSFPGKPGLVWRELGLTLGAVTGGLAASHGVKIRRKNLQFWVSFDFSFGALLNPQTHWFWTPNTEPELVGTVFVPMKNPVFISIFL